MNMFEKLKAASIFSEAQARDPEAAAFLKSLGKEKLALINIDKVSIGDFKKYLETGIRIYKESVAAGLDPETEIMKWANKIVA